MKRSLDRRLPNRVSCIAAARIIDDKECVTDCKMLDISATGARLELGRRSGVPKQFTLRVPSREIECRAEVVWQVGYEIGVYFLPESPDAIAVTAGQPTAKKTMSVAQLRQLLGR